MPFHADFNPARKYEKTDKTIKHLQTTIEEKDRENDKLEARIAELEVRIGKLNTEKYEIVQEFQTKEDEKRQLQQIIENHEFNFK